MSTARHHSEWLSLIEVSGPFLSMPVLVRVFPQGLDAHDPERHRTLRLAFEEWEANNEAGHRTNPAIHAAWIKFVLTSVLGFPESAILEGQAISQALQVSVPEHGEVLRPNLVIHDPNSKKDRLLIQTYRASQNLDKRVEGNSWQATPGTRMMELLHATGIRLGLVTNGERWMLVDAPRNETTGFASWYASLWLEEKITQQAFTSLLGAERFFNSPENNTLEAMLAESASNQQEVTDQLGYQVRRAVEVIVQSIDRADQDHDRHLLEGVDEKVLYEAALTVMMRLVFLFCAEERRLLPLDTELYVLHYAASTLREQLRKTADDHGEEILERRYDAWSRLLSTFRLVYGGCEHPNLRMPAYGGHLFNPDRFPFLEGRKRGTSWKNCEAEPLPINNRTVLHLLEALQLLEVKMPGGKKAARRLSFRALDIEQIGHVYEGLLDHTAKRATEPMLGLLGTRDHEPEVSLAKLEEMKSRSDDKLVEFLEEECGKSASALRKAIKQEIDLTTANRFQAVIGNDEKLLKRMQPFGGLVREDTFGYPVVIPKGSVFVTAGTDRRSSGTHYTPKSLTEPIVQYTLEPLVYIGPAEGKPKDQWQLRLPAELLGLKICDMACGSGAFLVQACRYLSERVVESWEAAERKLPKGTPGITPHGEASTGAAGEMLIPKDSDERLIYARRMVAQRCLYGVDINPLAAEMAKLSLWLLTLAKDKPFEFLDHAIRCGDSLVGIHNLEQLSSFNLAAGTKSEQIGSIKLPFLMNKVEEAIALRHKITDVQAQTVQDVEAQDRTLREANEKIDRLKCAADLLISAEFAPGSAADKKSAADDAAIKVTVHFADSDLPEFRREARKALGGRMIFHWPLEFPEVMVERDGFDAFVGNPPFMGGKKITGSFGVAYREYLVARLAQSERGNADLCAYFFLRAERLLRDSGQFGLLATNTIAQGDTREVGLEQLAAKSCIIIRAVASRPWPGTASLEVAHVWMRRGSWNGTFVLDDIPTNGINTFLASLGAVCGDPNRLGANDNLAFIGSIVLGMGFVLEPDEAHRLIDEDAQNKDVLFPYLNGEDLNSRPDQSPSRWVINFFNWPLEKAREYQTCLRIVEERVKPERDRLGLKGDASSKGYAKWWWQFGRKGEELYRTITKMDRVLVCPIVTKYLSFVFVPTDIVYMHKLCVFAFDQPHAFALLSSNFHDLWVRQYSSTLETRLNYSPADCFDTFAFPGDMTALANVGERYHESRRQTMLARREGLTKTYNRFHNSDETSADILRLRELHAEMDNAVAVAYRWTDLDLGHGFHETKQGVRYTISEPARREILARLLKLNHERYAEEVKQGLHEKKKGKAIKGTRQAGRLEAGPVLFGGDD